MALMRVFYEDWQMECCGTPFAVGDEVGWRLVAVDEPHGGRWCGAQAWVQNHGGPEHETGGRVHAIDLVHEEYAVRRDRSASERDGRVSAQVEIRPSVRSLEPVPGTGTLEPVEACPKWFGEQAVTGHGPHRVRRARGVLVTLQVSDGRPSQPGDRP